MEFLKKIEAESGNLNLVNLEECMGVGRAWGLTAAINAGEDFKSTTWRGTSGTQERLVSLDSCP